MKNNIARMCVFCIVFLLFLSVLNTNLSFVSQEWDVAEEEKVLLIDLSKKELSLLQTKIEVMEYYDNFILAKVTKAQKDYLTANKVHYSEIENKIKISDYEISANGCPDIPSEWTVENTDYYLIQFIGPVKEEWLPKVESFGVKIYNYIPNYAYIAKIPPFAKEKIGELPFVAGIHKYQPAYRVEKNLKFAKERNEIVKIAVYTFEPQVASKLKTKIAKVGYSVGYMKTAENFGKLIAEIPIDVVKEIAIEEGVNWIEPYYKLKIYNDMAQWVLQTAQPDNRAIWNKGIKGQGQVVAHADTGVSVNHLQFRDPARSVQYSYPGNPNPPDSSHRKIVNYWVFSDRDDYSGGHGTHTGCTLAGNDAPAGGTSSYDGMAPEAKFSIADCMRGHAETLDGIPGDLNDLFIVAYNDGARIHSNSWGGSVPDREGATPYTGNSMEADMFMWNHKDFLLFFSNGNHQYDPQIGAYRGRYVGSPANAKNVVSVGGCVRGTTDDIWSDSAWGPTRDGRLKPTVVSPYYLYSATGGTVTDYHGAPGTSMSSPAAAGATALIRQYFTEGWYPRGNIVAGNSFEPSAALMKAMLINSAVELSASTSNYYRGMPYPNNEAGWGRPLLENSMYFSGDSRKLFVVDDTYGLVTGESKEFEFYIADSSEPLEVTLVWTDYWANPNAAVVAVNNLDLLVTAPDGTEYKGNVFVTTGTPHQSTTGGSFDDVNVEEGVLRYNPPTGKWTAKIIGRNIPKGAQPYAFVVTGGLDGNAGRIYLDKPKYTENDVIKVTVEDSNAVSVEVSFTSDTQSTPVRIALTQRAPGSTVWEGTIETTPSAAGGKLQVSNGDTITATYSDANPSGNRVATATVDTTSPAITNVWVTNIGDTSATITWHTDKPANSTVKYGTSSALGYIAEDPTYGYFHSVTLVDLQPNTLYYFEVSSSDRLGHLVKDDNSGMYYKFSTLDRTVVLIVDATNQTYVCMDKYKSALDGKGWTYSIWDRRKRGPPPRDVLKEYFIVIWETGEKYPQFDKDEQRIVKEYEDGGGRLFVSSHDVAWDQGKPNEPNNHPAIAWFRAVVKAEFREDPATFYYLDGIVGNEISGAYTSVSYTPIREGGAGDEIGIVSSGGVGYSVWRDRGGQATNQPVALMWTSNAPNGTAGDGVWGGTQTQIVVFFFEFPQINANTPKDTTREDILDKVIRWLLSPTMATDHPDVSLTVPNGGEVWVGRQTITWDISSATAGTVDHIKLQYSDNGGQAWYDISGATNLPSTARSFEWDTFTVAEGGSYKIKVLAYTPIGLVGVDQSDGNFTISRVVEETSIQLFKGWNLISTKLSPQNKSPSEIFREIISNVTSVEWYDSSEGKWRFYSPEKEDYMNTLTSIDSTMGLWVYAKEDCILKISGSHGISTKIILRPGWNLVGYPSNKTTYTVGNLKSAIPDVKDVQGYSKTAIYRVESLPSDSRFEPMKGYWIYLSGNVEKEWSVEW